MLKFMKSWGAASPSVVEPASPPVVEPMVVVQTRGVMWKVLAPLRVCILMLSVYYTYAPARDYLKVLWQRLWERRRRSIFQKYVNRRGVSRMQTENIRYTWTIEDFSARPFGTGDKVSSPILSKGPDAKFKWYFCISESPGRPSNFVSVYLSVIPGNVRTKVHKRLDLAILDSSGREVNGAIGTSYGSCFGYDAFITRAELLSKSASLLTDDKLVLVCRITAKFAAEGSGSAPEQVTADNPAEDADDAEASLAVDLSRLLEAPLYSDVTLEAGGSKFKAHKNILCCRSPVFRAMFEHGTTEQTQSRIVITDVKPAVLQEMLRFIYTGAVHDLDQNVSELFAVADKYALFGLLAACEELLCSRLCVDNAVDTLLLAELHSADRVKAEAMNLIVSSAGRVVKSAGWSRLLTYPTLLAEVCEAQASASC